MGCFICFDARKSQEKKPLNLQNEVVVAAAAASAYATTSSSSSAHKCFTDDSKLKVSESTDSPKDCQHIAAQTFTFHELAVATKNFRSDCLIGEGGFGRVYKGRLESTGQIVAIKQLDRNGLQGNREFLVEVLMLSLLHHPNLVNLIGYCADGDQRLLVYEYMALGCLEDHLHYLPPDKESLDWNIRMKIAAGAARGLEYLHDKATPPVIYRDFKSSNILLNEGFHPKLSDFGLAKLGPIGDKTHVSTRVMGTYGYCAPEYAMTGQLTVKSDVYSFGVVLLELITGRKAIDNSRGPGEHNLVSWARPLFKDRKKFHQMADPLLQGCYPLRGLYQSIAVAAMCLQEDAMTRPVIADVVTALNYLASQNYDPRVHPVNKFSPSPSRDKKSPSPSRDNKKDKERKLSNGEERGFVERMFGSRSPVSHSPDNRDVRAVRQVGPRHSPDNRMVIRQMGGVRSPASRSPDNLNPTRDNLNSIRENGASRSPSRMSGAHGGSAAEDGFLTRKNDVEEWLVRSNGQQQGMNFQCPSDRERAVAEARIWGENWRDRKRGNLDSGFV